MQVKVLAVANPGLDPCAVHHKLGSMAHLTCERPSRTVKWSDGDGRTLVGVGDRSRYEARTNLLDMCWTNTTRRLHWANRIPALTQYSQHWLWLAESWSEVDREVGTCEFIPEPLRGNRSDGAFWRWTMWQPGSSFYFSYCSGTIQYFLWTGYTGLTGSQLWPVHLQLQFLLWRGYTGLTGSQLWPFHQHCILELRYHRFMVYAKSCGCMSRQPVQVLHRSREGYSTIWSVAFTAVCNHLAWMKMDTLGASCPLSFASNIVPGDQRWWFVLDAFHASTMGDMSLKVTRNLTFPSQCSFLMSMFFNDDPGRTCLTGYTVLTWSQLWSVGFLFVIMKLPVNSCLVPLTLC